MERNGKQVERIFTPETVRNVLTKTDYHSRTTAKKCFISEKNRKVRLEFVNKTEK